MWFCMDKEMLVNALFTGSTLIGCYFRILIIIGFKPHLRPSCMIWDHTRNEMVNVETGFTCTSLSTLQINTIIEHCKYYNELRPYWNKNTHVIFSYVRHIQLKFFFRSKMLLVLFLLQRILADNVNDKYDLDLIFEVLT